MTTADKPRSRSLARFLVGVLVGLVIAGAVGTAVVAPLLLTHHESNALETAYGAAVVNLTTQALSANVGAGPADARAVRSASEAYLGSCAQCHGAGGTGRGMLGQTTFPPATDLTGPTARALSDAQLFYIVKFGLGFTAMPAYASQYADRDLWGFVTYIRALQSGQAPTAAVPAPAGGASPAGNASRGAAIYVAQGCATCHGTAPGQARPEREAGNIQRTVRSGRPGMPRYPVEQLSDAELADLIAFAALLPAGGGSGR